MLDIELACLQIVLDQLVDELSVVTSNASLEHLHEILTDAMATTTDHSDTHSEVSQDLDRWIHEHAELQNELHQLEASLNSMQEYYLDEIDDTKQICAFEERMADSWLNARVAQLEAKFADQMDEQHDDRQQTQQKLVQNAIIAENLADYESMKMAKLDANIAMWQKRYATELRDVEDEEILHERIAANFRTERRECEEAYVRMTAMIEANANDGDAADADDGQTTDPVLGKSKRITSITANLNEP